MAETLIELQDIYKIYQMGDTEVRALDGVSLTIKRGEFVAIVGQSGSGKSTCMNIIGCLDVPTSGSYHLNGVDVSTMKDDEQAEIRNKMLGFIFQQYNLIPKLNLCENVELPLLYAGLSPAERQQRALASLERVGLREKAQNLPSQLSGGQQQRVSIARAFLKNPPILILDEATSALDNATEMQIQSALHELSAGRTALVVAHRLSTIKNADEIIVVTADGIEERGTHEELIAKGGAYRELYEYQFKNT